MAKKLRLRFIWISMLSLVAVVVVIALTINLTNYAKVRYNADELLLALEANDGTFFAFGPREGNAGQPSDTDEQPPAMPNQREMRAIEIERLQKRDFNAETPYDTRYFTVRVAEDGSLQCDVDRIAAVSTADATTMAEQALSAGKSGGYIGTYRYLVGDDGRMVLFVDCFSELRAADINLTTSLIVSAATILGMLVLVLLLSKRAVQPIVEAYERQRQFVTEASHELKTPITIISANNELLQLEYGDNESTDAIEHQVKRLSSMVQNLVSLSRLDEVAAVAKGDCNLSDCLLEHVDLYRSALEADGRTLDVDADSDVMVAGNTDMLAQMVSVLLDNAIKYAATFTRVHLHRDKSAVLTVENDAAGLTDGDKNRCFERFYRDADVVGAVEGSGIGLSIVKQIVTLHHGTASASAKDGVFTLTVTLP